MTRLPVGAALVAGWIVAAGTPVLAQSLTSEVSVTAGASTDDVSAGAMQARVSADTPAVRIFAEVAWAASAGPESDAFGAAYPYEHLNVMEAYGERTFRGGRAIASVRAGRFRTPFGIYAASDHGYGGFLRAPLIRYAGYWALSNTFLEHGVNVMAGVPALQAEYTAATPGDPGDTQRRGGFDQVVRVQGYHGSLVVGASHIRTQPYQPARYAFGRAVFSGVDARWMRGGVQLRGEWIDGQPFDDMHTRGGYVDAFVHTPAMGRVTAVARAEVLDYDAGPRSVLAKRGTLGARVLVADGLYAQINAAHQMGALYSEYRNSIDVALTYTVRYGR